MKQKNWVKTQRLIYPLYKYIFRYISLCFRADEIFFNEVNNFTLDET